MSAERIIAAAKGWLGTPYHHMARIKGVGVDCVQLLMAVYEEAGLIDHVEVGYYAPDWHLHREREMYMEGLIKHSYRVEGQPQPGDVALYRFGRCAAHGAIVVKWPIVIHAYIGRGCVWGSDSDAELSGRLDSIWRCEEKR